MSDDHCQGRSIDQIKCNTQFCSSIDVDDSQKNIILGLLDNTGKNDNSKLEEKSEKRQVFPYWSEWSECNQTCGKEAIKIRERKCVDGKAAQVLCPQNLINQERISCGLGPCEVWTNWSTMSLRM